MACKCHGIDENSWKIEDGKCMGCDEPIDDDYENLDVELLKYLKEWSDAFEKREVQESNF